MSGMKTTPQAADVTEFLQSIAHDRRRKDAFSLLELIQENTGMTPVMWGPSIVGFGSYQYQRKDGSEHQFFLTGFAPRKSALTIYIMTGFDAFNRELANLGPHKISKSCLYITNLEKVDVEVLTEIIVKSVAQMQATYKSSP